MRTGVAWIADPVCVGIELIGVVQTQAVVAGVADPVAVHIGLVRVVHARTVVADIRHTVSSVETQRPRFQRALLAGCTIKDFQRPHTGGGFAVEAAEVVRDRWILSVRPRLVGAHDGGSELRIRTAGVRVEDGGYASPAVRTWR